MNKNKKAEMTMEEIIKIILAVAGIIILIMLASSLYGIVTAKTKIEQARASLAILSDKLKDMKVEEKRSFLLESPQDWFVLSYNANTKESCGTNSCICLCEESDCSGEKSACTNTDKKVVLKKDNKEVNSFHEKLPAEFNLNFDSVMNSYIMEAK